jgi:hypothetical protein
MEILRRDVQVLDHILTMEINPFYIDLTKTDDYYRECLGNQASFTVGTTPAHTIQIPKSGNYNGKQRIIGLHMARIL